MTRSQSIGLLLLLLLLAAGVLLFSPTQPGPGPSPVRGSADEEVVGAQGLPLIKDANHARNTVLAEDASVRIVRFRVVDESGHTIEDVRIRLFDASTHRELGGLEARPAVSAGTIAVRLQDRLDVVLAAIVEASGYAYGWCDPVAEEPAVNQIVLCRSFSLVVNCRTTSGDPVPDCKIVCCGNPIDPDAVDVRVLGSHRSRRSEVASDAKGIARIGGLVRQRYSMYFEHPFMILVTRLPTGIGVELAGDTTIDVQLAEPLVAATAFEVEPTVSWRRYPQTLGYPQPFTCFPGAILRRLGAEVVEHGWSQWAPSVAVKRPDFTSDRHFLVSMGFFPGSGWAVAEHPYRPAREARVDVVTRAQAKPCEQGRLVCSLRDAAGAVSMIDGCRLSLRSLHGDVPQSGKFALRLPLYVGFRLGEALELPCGEYALEVPDAAFGLEFAGSTSASVLPGGFATIELVEKQETCSLALTVVDQESVALSRLQVRIRPSGGAEVWTWYYSEAEPRCFVPPGTYELEVEVADEFLPHAEQVVVGNGTTRQVERTIVLRRR